MIKYIKIGEIKMVANQVQIEQFAWLDTKRNRFLKYNGKEAWFTWDEFEADFEITKREAENWATDFFTKLRKLYPKGKK